MVKGNDGSGNFSDRDLWRTPLDLFNPLNEQYNFVFDCCASEEDHLCPVWSSDFKKREDVPGVAWMNPPFSKARHMFEHFFEVVSKGVAIYRCDNMETKLWQEVILENADWVFIPKGRVNYEGFEGGGARFPSALIGIGVDPVENVKGKTLEVD